MFPEVQDDLSGLGIRNRLSPGFVNLLDYLPHLFRVAVVGELGFDLLYIFYIQCKS